MKKGCLLNLVLGVCPCADDLIRDVSGLRYGGSERADMGPGATLPVEHFPLQGPDTHGSP